MEENIELQPGQILCLEDNEQHLYVELIQIASDRTEGETRGNSCWVRPLILVDSSYEPPIVEDLRNASDLLWQLDSFRVALDTEVIAYFHQVLIKEPELDYAPLAKQKLNRFVQQIWHNQGKREGAR